MNPWTLPAPLNLIVWLAAKAGWLIWWWLTTTTRNIAELGPAWVVTYWLAVVGSIQLGAWGLANMHKARAGNDIWEFGSASRVAQLLGRPATRLYRLQVAGEAVVPAVAAASGYAIASGLLLVGLAWRWLAVLVGGWLTVKALELRRRRRAWWT